MIDRRKSLTYAGEVLAWGERRLFSEEQYRSKQPKIPDPAAAAVSGIQTDAQLQPFNYLINAASTLGVPVTINGQTYDFTGQGQADVAGQVSNQMAQTLLALQTEKSPAIIQAQIDQLKAADPQGYAARQDLFDRILADAQQNPISPVSPDLQQQLQDQLAKGVGFSDAKQLQQVQEGVRGQQVASGIYRGNAATSAEGKAVVNAGESLQQQRQQNALNLLESGASPQDVAYRQFQQTLGNLGSFVNGQTPSAQFGQVSAASSGPVQLYGGAPSTNTFNPNAAAAGLNNTLGIYQGQVNWNNSQANPWLAGLSTTATTAGALNQLGLFGAPAGTSPWSTQAWTSNPAAGGPYSGAPTWSPTNTAMYTPADYVP